MMLKKIFCNIFVFLLLIFSMAYITNINSTVYATKIEVLHYDGSDHEYTGPEVTLLLNKKPFEVTENLMQPIILENRTLVPVREVFETLGGKVNWDTNERRVDVILGSKNISLWIDKTEAKVDGKSITIDVPAKIINSKTMVPARFISEQGNLVVDWDNETKTVSITTPVAKVEKIEYTKMNQTDCVVVTADSAISGYKYFMLEEPYRLILDVENSKFSIDMKTQTIEEDSLVSTMRFGEQGNNVNRIVLDLKKETDYIVVPSEDRTKLYFAMTNEFVIPSETNQSSGNQEIPDEENSNHSDESQNSNSSGESNSENQNPNASGENNSENQNPNASGESNSENQDSSTSGENNLEIPNLDDSGDDELDAPNKNEEENIVLPDVLITSVKYSTVSKRIKIGYDGDIEYKASFLTNPNRIVIDIESAELRTEGPKEINPKGSVVTGIRFSQYEENTVRVVLDLSDKVDYKIYKRTSELQVAVIQPTYKNVAYKLNTANAQITLLDVDIDDLSASTNATSDKYTIKFASRDFDCGEGDIEPEDNFVEAISISSSKIVITSPDNMTYTMRQSGENVIITIKKEEKKPSSNDDKKVILIDAGHGGNDPGACNGSAQEKVFNLNIALMLYELLSERDDVDVYISRETDKYLSREDRVALATEIDPNLIVSVHNNSLDNKAYTGTMVLYYNNSTESLYGDVTSKECAQIVLNKLVSALETVNRGAVNREDLHILSKTPCPSILCEVCFISNDEELERLKTKKFQQDAAQAIYDGVVEILEIM